MEKRARGNCSRLRCLAASLVLVFAVLISSPYVRGSEGNDWRGATEDIIEMIADGDIDGARHEIRARRDVAGSGLSTRQSFQLDMLEFLTISADDSTVEEVEYMAMYRDLEQRVHGFLATSALEGDDHAVVDDCATYQSLAMAYLTRLSTDSRAETLQSRCQEMARSTQLLKDSLESQRDILETRQEILTYNVATGMHEHTEMSAGQHRRILRPRQLQAHLIISLEAAGARDEAGADTLAAAYCQYATDYPTAAISGTYLNLAMEIEGKVDLDELCSLYDRCEERDTRQYHGAILGLSHLLNDAGESGRAFKYLDQIDEEYLPVSRIPELHFAKGLAYYQTKEYGEALRFFTLVTLETDRYQSAEGYIDEMLGFPSALEEEVFDTQRLSQMLESVAEVDSRKSTGSPGFDDQAETDSAQTRPENAYSPPSSYVALIVGSAVASIFLLLMVHKRKVRNR